VTALFRYDVGRDRLTRLTAERNGVEEPSLDRRTGRIVYSRCGSTVRGRGRDVRTVNVWQGDLDRADGTDPRLVASVRASCAAKVSTNRRREGRLAYGVLGDVAGLAPSPGKTEVVRVRRAGRAARGRRVRRFEDHLFTWQRPRVRFAVGRARPCRWTMGVLLVCSIPVDVATTACGS